MKTTVRHKARTRIGKRSSLLINPIGAGSVQRSNSASLGPLKKEKVRSAMDRSQRQADDCQISGSGLVCERAFTEPLFQSSDGNGLGRSGNRADLGAEAIPGEDQHHQQASQNDRPQGDPEQHDENIALRALDHHSRPSRGRGCRRSRGSGRCARTAA
jgi:hypothetical protein